MNLQTVSDSAYLGIAAGAIGLLLTAAWLAIGEFYIVVGVCLVGSASFGFGCWCLGALNEIDKQEEL